MHLYLYHNIIPYISIRKIYQYTHTVHFPVILLLLKFIRNTFDNTISLWSVFSVLVNKVRSQTFLWSDQTILEVRVTLYFNITWWASSSFFWSNSFILRNIWSFSSALEYLNWVLISAEYWVDSVLCS